MPECLPEGLWWPLDVRNILCHLSIFFVNWHRVNNRFVIQYFYISSCAKSSAEMSVRQGTSRMSELRRQVIVAMQL